RALSDERKPGALRIAMAHPAIDSPGTARVFPPAVDLLAAAAERFGGGERFGRHGHGRPESPRPGRWPLPLCRFDRDSVFHRQPQRAALDFRLYWLGATAGNFSPA